MQRLEEQRVVRSKIAQDKRDAHVMGVCRRHIGHQRRTSCYLTKQNSLSIKAHECVRVRVRVRVCVRVCVCACACTCTCHCAYACMLVLRVHAFM